MNLPNRHEIASIYEAQHVAYALRQRLGDLPCDAFSKKDFKTLLSSMDIVQNILRSSRVHNNEPQLPRF